eukprot:GCRY01004309.1.p1 GENE.GCRY01004309.1~~GCRY01004309.1.p1  ORF type:complete len:281 (+),score=57.25 GCRY01004309.1:117-959(+)
MKVFETFGNERWFPGSQRVLKRDIDNYMKKAESHVAEFQDPVVACIVPHAGYQFSGPIAAYSFQAIKKSSFKPDTVVVLGFPHRMNYTGVALMEADILRSPLGDTPLDNESAQFLIKQSSKIFFDNRPHSGEHSAENEIPFVQEVLPNAKIVVGLIGDHSESVLSSLVDGIVALSKQKKILVVASSDMLHDADYDFVSREDRRTLEKVDALDVEAVRKSWSYDNQVFCGISPVLVAMRVTRALQGCAHVLHYRNCGDDFPESRGSWVVGYGAVAFTAPQQ